ncbi:MAG TPA: SufS family cysteine desulfurase [Alphaproteobacteria bacterium]|nr:cysteine desulfurase [Rhodospirillaceae bacterium]HRJ11680.1 SufS family cysteine desulfurase [Alphaproteobacteria bacterium]
MLPAGLKDQFPVFKAHPRLTYLDTAATAQKPQLVLDAMQTFYAGSYANVHRGVYDIARRATEAYEKSKSTVAAFISARADEIIYTKNATEAINLLAHSFGASLNVADEIIISELEHHANIVPWHMLRERKGIIIKVIPLLADGTLDLDAYQQLLTSKTKLVSVTGMSNALGIIPPMNKIIGMAHHMGAKVMIDASQLIYHAPVNVRDLNCDFMVFTGHKCYGPSGIGVLYGKSDLLNDLPPFLGGGDMIETVAFDKITYAAPPRRFEAGTPPIAEAVGLAAAIDFMRELGMQNIAEHDSALHAAMKLELQNMPRVKIHGAAATSGIISFTVDGAHPQDIATLLDKQNIAVRVGHHCCMPLMQKLDVTATARISFGVYNTMDDVSSFTNALTQTLEMLS